MVIADNKSALRAVLRLCERSYGRTADVVDVGGDVTLCYAPVAPALNGDGTGGVLAIAGSNSLPDWLRNLALDQVHLPSSAFGPSALVHAARVHRGFADAALRVRNWLMRVGLDTPTAVRGPRLSVIAGHSLGGGIAQVLATLVPCRQVVTFGAPAAGDAEFAALLDSRARLGMPGTYTRVEHRRDPVCGALDAWRYRRAGQLVSLGTQYGAAWLEDVLRLRLVRGAIADHALSAYAGALQHGLEAHTTKHGLEAHATKHGLEAHTTRKE